MNNSAVACLVYTRMSESSLPDAMNEADQDVVDATATEPSRAELSAFQHAATPSQGTPTASWVAQRAVEQKVFMQQRLAPREHVLLRRAHCEYVTAGLTSVPASYTNLHSSQPWLLYWMLHSADLLGKPLSSDISQSAIRHLHACRDEDSGGFGGGPGQEPHMACTYAAVAALAIIGTEEAYKTVQPSKLQRFIKSLKRPDGGFLISKTGEKDVRSLYSAVAAASLAGILDTDITARVDRYVTSLKSFDNAFGGEPCTEAHGGNTYCGVAAALICGARGSLDSEAIVDWAAMRQCRFEGGFCGRANKLVDSCYSFWVGALFPMLDASHAFNADALQRYILTCCQDERGGLRDKPDVVRDFHHTCYALSGLSVAQHYGDAVIGVEENKVKKVDVLHNVCEDKLQAMRAYLQRHSP